MHFFVVLSMVVAMAQASNAPTPAEKNSCSGLKDDRSLLSSLLTATGYSDTCVTAALDLCSTAKEDSHNTSHMEVRVSSDCLSKALFILCTITQSHEVMLSQDMSVYNRNRNRNTCHAAYSGDAGDSLAYHNFQLFSTHDADNDNFSGSCAEG
ncbi:Angiopoietin-related protein 6 [Portunus trituberculatus]|uniref:Angiopoietin-related protein 6 n=1 Tax=Portunus trituberculatus TaxID=210409 RepID=A0A5B7CVD7_PORTR|nr:Angiopoietin-related protein 6 [Portunus trituberculatus]